MDTEKARYTYWQGNQSFAEKMLKDPEWQTKESSEREQIISVLPDLNGHRILELGAGVGRFTNHFAQLALALTAVDFKKEDLEKNKNLNTQWTNIQFICNDVTHLEQEAKSFDLIFSNWLLMYLLDEEIPDFLSKCYHWLDDEGVIFFRESCETNYKGYSLLVFYLAGRIHALTGIKLNKDLNPPNVGWKDLWKWLFEKKRELPFNYRKLKDYEDFFSEKFEVIAEGHIFVYQQFYNNKNQRYWLLSKKKPR